MKALLFSICLVFIAFSGLAQEPTISREIELQNYFWSNPDSAFSLTEIPEKWQNESAVILGKRIEYRVKKKSFSNKLLEHHYFHQRIKLLDNHAVEAYSEFSFGEDNKRYRGFFSYETVNYYMGIKVEKSDGRVEIVEMDEAVKKELESGNHKYALNKIAVPNLQVGDIIDFYQCIERKFPQKGFYSFSPVFYELADEYPIVKQTIHLEMLRNCYLNAKSINGAPQLKVMTSEDDEKTNIFVMEDENREKIKEEEWVNIAQDYPILKFQAFFNAISTYVTQGYEQFFGESIKLKSSVNTNALEPMTHNLRSSIVNSYSPYYSIYRATFKYLKGISKASERTTDDLIREGYFFLREYWYQQYFHIYPQYLYYGQISMDEMIMTSILSASLYKLKRKHEVIFIPSSEYTRDEDLLFLGELTPGIKSNSDNPIIITAINHSAIPNDIPVYLKGNKAYSVKIDRATTFNTGVGRFDLPEDQADDNKRMVKSTISFNEQNDSVNIRSLFTLTGAEKASWDSVLFVKQILRDEFKLEKYKNYIHDSEQGNMASRHAQEKKANMDVEIEKEAQDRIQKIEDKLKLYYGLGDLSLKNFELKQYGRWDDQQEMIFEVSFTTGDLITNAGRTNLLSVGRLIHQIGQLLEEERHFDVWLPYKRKVQHQVHILLNDKIDLSGAEQLQMNYNDGALHFSSVVKENETALEITTSEVIGDNYVPKEKWNTLREYYRTIREINNAKLKVQTR